VKKESLLGGFWSSSHFKEFEEIIELAMDVSNNRERI
jgi:hypothetical protein